VKQAMRLANRRIDSIDVLQRLREDKAVERVRRYFIGLRQVADEGRTRVAGVEIENVTAVYSIAKSLRVDRLLHLEDPASDVRPVLRQKALDVVTVYGSAAIIAEVVAQRPGAAKRPEDCGTDVAPETLAKAARCHAQLTIVHAAPFSTAILTDSCDSGSFAAVIAVSAKRWLPESPLGGVVRSTLLEIFVYPAQRS
jgi:hypothetical protein